jgi:hypothetical protein
MPRNRGRPKPKLRDLSRSMTVNPPMGSFTRSPAGRWSSDRRRTTEPPMPEPRPDGRSLRGIAHPGLRATAVTGPSDQSGRRNACESSLHLILRRVRQRAFVLEDLAEIAALRSPKPKIGNTALATVLIYPNPLPPPAARAVKLTPITELCIGRSTGLESFSYR